MSKTLKNYLLDSLKVSEKYIFEYSTRTFYDPSAPTSKETAVEWDGVFPIDYSEKLTNETLHYGCPPHFTLFLLETKQNIWLDQVLSNIERRITRTVNAVSQKLDVSRNKRTPVPLELQANFFKDVALSKVVVAIGAINMNATLAAEITSAGYLAVKPSRNDFMVVERSL